MNPAEDFKQYRDYFKAIAEADEGIKHSEAEPHFSMMYLEEILTRATLDCKDVCMIVEYPDFTTFNEQNVDNNFLKLIGGISIIKFFEHDDFEDHLLKASECLVIAKRVIKKIFADYEACREDEEADPNINYFESSGIRGGKIGPVFGSWTGVRFVPVIGNPFALYD
jgi:hypothetical protein